MFAEPSGVAATAADLIRFRSVSSGSNREVSDYVISRLTALGFDIEPLVYFDAADIEKVSVVAVRGEGEGGIAYLAHSDVVPADDWHRGEPAAYQADLLANRLYGRGSCDMKGSIAAALHAAETVDPRLQTAPLYFVVTSDEEVGMHGAKLVRDRSKIYRRMVDGGCVGIVGEPTSLRVIHSHKGAVVLHLTSRGESAHSSSVAGENANDRLFAALPELSELRLRTESDPSYRNADFDPPTLSWNWVVRNEPFAANVKTAKAELRIFLRPMPGVEGRDVVAAAESIAERHGLDFIIDEHTGLLHTPADATLVRTMLELTGASHAQTACYATDGGVLSELAELVVCGPGDIAQAHTRGEWVSLDQLTAAVALYSAAFRLYTEKGTGVI